MYLAILSTTYFMALVSDGAMYPVSVMPCNQGGSRTNRTFCKRKEETSRVNLEVASAEGDKVADRCTRCSTQGGAKL